MIQKVGFYGLGLIGGSVARALKEKYPDVRILATSGHASTVKEAYAAGVIENEDPLSPEEFRGVDILFLCAPVGKNIEYLSQIGKATGEETILTDVGSVKGTIHKEAERLELSHRFIGGHPMTGSEKTGFSNSAPLLLENAYYLLTPEQDVPEEKVKMFRELVASIRSIPMILKPEEHDRAVAAISHLPHVMASGLVNLVRKTDDENELLKHIAAGGFRDITRIASSSPEMWESICLENREEVLHLLGLYIKELSEARECIEHADGEEIRTFFADAKNYRDSFTIKAGRRLCYELFMDLKDSEGQIALTTSILAIRRINLKNIGIVHNREFEDGVLHIEFYDEESLEKASEILKEYGYTLYLR